MDPVEQAAAALSTLSTYLARHIPELSYLISSMLMFFLSDLIMERFFLKRLRKLNFFSRTLAFILYGLLALPGLTVAGAAILRASVLEPFKGWIVLILALSFLLTGLLLSLKYGLKIRLK